MKLSRMDRNIEAGYAAAHDAAALIERPDRALLRITGRDPVKMINGLVTNDVAGAPEGRGVFALLLTPKGKMLAELRIFRRGDGLVLECAAAARDNVTDTLRKFVPPLFARWSPMEDHGVIGVHGPASRDVVARALDVDLQDDVAEHAFVVAPHDAGEVIVTRTLYAGVDGWDVLAPVSALGGARDALVSAGAHEATADVLELLRVEAGRPRWGAELTEDVIPLEAGLRESAISESKGCYTGQEIIIRILHRGHVNWHLRGFLLGELEPPAAGTHLIDPAQGRKVARITSAVASPRFGQTIALGYARRELELPATARLERADGPEVGIVELPFSDSA